MPTIDELAPATASSDTDEFPINQNGVTVKVTRAQVLSGIQPQMALPSGVLIGGPASGTGAPVPIAVGANLTLANGTITATAAPYSVSQLPAGVVPSPGDMISMSQGGTGVAVSFRNFMSGLPTVANVDISQTVLKPTGAAVALPVAQLVAGLLPMTGGTMTGPLGLAALPTAPLQATTKSYVDTQIGTALPKTGGSLTGALSLAADPASMFQAATKNYVDTQIATALPKAGGTLVGQLTLATDPSTALQAATKEYVDLRLLRTGDTLTGALTLPANPVSILQAATKGYVDAQVATNLLQTGGSLSGPIILAADPSLPLQAATKEYVDTRVLRTGDTLTGALVLAANPVASLQASTKGYVDTQISSVLPLTGGTVSGPVILAANPTAPLGAVTKQYSDAHLLRAGDTLTGMLVLAANPTSAMQAATKNYVDMQMATPLPLAGGTITGVLILGGDPVSSLQASTKHYVDTQVGSSLPLTGGSLSGALVLAASPVIASQAANKQYVDGQIATTLPIQGGTLTGNLALASDPISPLHAATKQYVDANPTSNGVINIKLPPYNARINGTTDDTAAFIAAYQAAPVGSTIYVPNGVTIVQPPANWGIPLTKRVKWIVDGTTLSDGTALADSIPTGANPSTFALPSIAVGNSPLGTTVSQAGSQSTDFAVSHSSYIVNHNGGTSGNVGSNSRTDTIIYNSPNNYIWGGLDRLVWAGIQTPTASTPAQHVGRYVQALRQSIGLAANGTALPQPAIWAACLEYRDTTGEPSSWTNAALTVEMDWYGNGPDDASNRQVQSLVIGQHNTSGTPVVVSTVIGVYLAAGSTGNVNTVFLVGIPFATSVLDTTNAVQMTGAAAIRLAAGQVVAFEPTVSYRLGFDSATNTLRWYQNAASYVVGKGISVGWDSVCTGNTSLPASSSGNIIFLTGSSAYTVTLPAASTVAAGTGFTFSVTGTANVSISPKGTDGIDQGPVTLRPNDRYHIVSDGSGTWREEFHSNMVSPKFTGPPVLPSYTVSNLPAAPGAGAKAFTLNGRKPGEAAGAGTGVEVFFDGSHWISVCSGSTVTS